MSDDAKLTVGRVVFSGTMKGPVRYDDYKGTIYNAVIEPDARDRQILAACQHVAWLLTDGCPRETYVRVTHELVEFAEKMRKQIEEGDGRMDERMDGQQTIDLDKIRMELSIAGEMYTQDGKIPSEQHPLTHALALLAEVEKRSWSLQNGLVETKDGEVLDVRNGLHLDGYAIIPVEKYRSLVDEVERLRAQTGGK